MLPLSLLHSGHRRGWNNKNIRMWCACRTMWRLVNRGWVATKSREGIWMDHLLWLLSVYFGKLWKLWNLLHSHWIYQPGFGMQTDPTKSVDYIRSMFFYLYCLHVRHSPLVSVVNQELQQQLWGCLAFQLTRIKHICATCHVWAMHQIHIRTVSFVDLYMCISISIYYQLHRTDFTSSMLSWLCTPNFVKDRFLKGNCSQNNKPMDSSVLDTYNWEPEPVEPFVWPRCGSQAPKWSFTSRECSNDCNFDPKNITFPVLGPYELSLSENAAKYLGVEIVFHDG